MGVDPGSRITGYGFLDPGPDGPHLVECGQVEVASGVDFPSRLAEVYQALTQLILLHQPQEMAVEETFFGKNPRSVLSLGQVRGVAVLAGALAGIEVAEYAPREVKMAVVGDGRATKERVQAMVTRLLRLAEPLESLDAADSLAVALCHGHRRGYF